MRDLIARRRRPGGGTASAPSEGRPNGQAGGDKRHERGAAIALMLDVLFHAFGVPLPAVVESIRQFGGTHGRSNSNRRA